MEIDHGIGPNNQAISVVASPHSDDRLEHTKNLHLVPDIARHLWTFGRPQLAVHPEPDDQAFAERSTCSVVPPRTGIGC